MRNLAHVKTVFHEQEYANVVGRGVGRHKRAEDDEPGQMPAGFGQDVNVFQPAGFGKATCTRVPNRVTFGT